MASEIEVCAYLDPSDRNLGKLAKHVTVGNANTPRTFQRLVWDYLRQKPRPPHQYLAYFVNNKRVTPERAMLLLGARLGQDGEWYDGQGVVPISGQ